MLHVLLGRKAVGSNPAGEALFGAAQVESRPPHGGILPEDSLLQSWALSEPAGECEDPAGEALFGAAQVESRPPCGGIL